MSVICQLNDISFKNQSVDFSIVCVVSFTYLFIYFFTICAVFLLLLLLIYSDTIFQTPLGRSSTCWFSSYLPFFNKCIYGYKFPVKLWILSFLFSNWRRCLLLSSCRFLFLFHWVRIQRQTKDSDWIHR